MRQHDEVGYHLSQFLSGHGCFQSYLNKIKRADSAAWVYCREDEDTARHTFYVCPRLEQERHRLMCTLETVITPRNIVRAMLEGPANWESVNSFVTRVIKKKLSDEKKAEPIPIDTR